MKRSWTTFLLMTIGLWLLAHSLALFSHEFCHSFTASALGWKVNPLALNWGTASPMNLLLQVEIDENVNYQPIFATGHAYQAGDIALAGMGLGNAIISLGIGLGLFALAMKHDRTGLGCFAYWLVVMSIGNLISYVPLRVFTSHGDMHTVSAGFGWTPNQLLWRLGPPIFGSLLWFFLRFQPSALERLYPESAARRIVLIVLTSTTFFGWFSLAGMWGYGELCQFMSIAFACLLTPVSIWCGLVFNRSVQYVSAVT